jgi:hypothetical protein
MVDAIPQKLLHCKITVIENKIYQIGPHCIGRRLLSSFPAGDKHVRKDALDQMWGKAQSAVAFDGRRANARCWTKSETDNQDEKHISHCEAARRGSGFDV